MNGDSGPTAHIRHVLSSARFTKDWDPSAIPAPKLPQPTSVPQNQTRVPNALCCHCALKCGIRLDNGHGAGCGQESEKHRPRNGQGAGCAKEQVAASLGWAVRRCPRPGPWRELSRGPQAWDIGSERASDRCLSATSSCFALPSKYAPFRLRKNRFV